MSADRVAWRRCSVCKQAILCGEVYWVCSVSTCNRKRTGLAFCSTECWDAHVPVMRHRESWAVEERAPSRPEPRAAPTPPTPSAATPPGAPAISSSAGASREPRRVVVGSGGPSRPGPAPHAGRDLPREVLVVASKLKSYVRAASGMNTSDRVLEALSEHVRAICDRAIEAARRDERKTVLERDVPTLPRRG